jgi:hypothetical protein
MGPAEIAESYVTPRTLDRELEGWMREITVSSFRKAGRPVLWLAQGHHSVAFDRGELLHSGWPRPLLVGADWITRSLEKGPERSERSRRRAGVSHPDTGRG